MKENPTAAVDALLESATRAGKLVVHPLTVARYSLLELLQSPLVVVVDAQSPLAAIDVIPSIFVMTQEAKDLAKYNSKNIDILKEDALEWAEDQVTAASIPAVVNMLAQKLLDLKRIAPEVIEDSKKKLDD